MAALGKSDADILSNVNTHTRTLNYQRLNIIVTPDEDGRQKGDEFSIEVKIQAQYSLLMLLTG